MKKNYVVFDAFKTNSAGVWYFVPDSGVFTKGKPCKGFGSVKYSEGSVYTGELYYDGKNFNKYGNGQQDFSQSLIGAPNKHTFEKKYKYVGRFDYRKTDWIYGNGVLYYTDLNGNPTHFTKGFFRGLEKIKEYNGEFDGSALLSGYDKGGEFQYDEISSDIRLITETAVARCKGLARAKALFVGDSDFGLSDNCDYCGKNSFSATFPSDCVNIGVNGSRFCDWLRNIEALKNLPRPDAVVINLGFNDLHSGRSVKKVYAEYKAFLAKLREIFPNTLFYLINAVHTPQFSGYCETENDFNALTAKSAEKLGVRVADVNPDFARCEEYCFHCDGVHFNERGYGIFFGFIKRLLNIE